jgi:hypothetical protein
VKIKVIDWRENYRLFFGELKDDKAQVWYETIIENVQTATERDLDEAVAKLAATWDYNSSRSKPNFRDIMKVVFDLKGMGRMEYRAAASIIERGKALLHKCRRGDHSGMYAVISCDHGAWAMDRMASIKMWTENISKALEVYASDVLGFNRDQVELPDWQQVLSQTANSMSPTMEEPF